MLNTQTCHPDDSKSISMFSPTLAPVNQTAISDVHTETAFCRRVVLPESYTCNKKSARHKGLGGRRELPHLH